MRSRELRVGGLTPLTTIDYPGELAAVVFCQGCPWRCRYCHNGELLAARGKTESAWSTVVDFLAGRRGLLDAVVFSGGEPTLQPALGDAVRQVKALGFKAGLHTAGIFPDRLERLLPELDWVGLDIKGPEDGYTAITEVFGSGNAAWESVRRLAAATVAYEVRVTVHPCLLSPEKAAATVERLEAMGVRRIALQACHTENSLDRTLRAQAATDLRPFHKLSRAYPELSFRP